MKILLFSFLIMSNFCFAGVGSILKIAGTNNAYLIRGDSRIPVSPEMQLELDDQIFSNEAHLVIFVLPGTQMSLARNTEIKISEHLIEENKELQKSFSVIDFIKGIIRVQVTKSEGESIEQTIQAQDVAFAVRGTEFEVSYDQANDVELDVVEGEVVVSSPHVHTFVPEVVKAKEGFKFNRKKKAFARRKFRQQLKQHPGFLNKEQFKKLKRLKRERQSNIKEMNRKSFRKKLQKQKRNKKGRNN